MLRFHVVGWVIGFHFLVLMAVVFLFYSFGGRWMFWFHRVGSGDCFLFLVLMVTGDGSSGGDVSRTG